MAYFWKDIDINFNKKNNGDIVDMTNEDAIANSLTNVFRTIQGTRRMVPDFAMPIYNLLFEPIDEITAGRLAELIWDAVERWETRINIEGLDIVAHADAGYYELNLNYSIGSSGLDNTQNFTDLIKAK